MISQTYSFYWAHCRGHQIYLAVEVGKDVGNINGELCEACPTAVPLVSVSASQKLSHLFLLHRTYRTPQELHKWGCRDSPLCPKCQREHGDLLHMLWKCPKLFRDWTEVMSTIAQVHSHKLKRDPVVGLSHWERIS